MADTLEFISSLNPVHAIDVPLGEFAASVGFPLDQLKFVLCLLLAYPVALVYRQLPASPNTKHLFNLVTGFSMCWFCFGFQTLNLVFSSLVVYLIAGYVRSPVAPRIIFAFAIVYMSVCHIYRQYTNFGGYDLDFTGPQMVLTLKLSSFGYNVMDGQRERKGDKSVTDDQRRYLLPHMPSLLQFFAFVFFFGSIMAGPACEMADYLRFVDTSMFKDYPHHGSGSEQQQKQKQEETAGDGHSGCYQPPSLSSVLLPAGIKVAVSFLALAIMLNSLPVDYVLSQEYAAKPLVYRIAYMWISVAMTRASYYFAWCLAEGACILTGMGYNGVSSSGVVRWDRMTACYIAQVEGATNMRAGLNNWNIPTAHWLKHYVYLRLPASMPRALRTNLTFTMSALWHGFYAGYYLTFVSAAFGLEVARGLRSVLRPLVVDNDTNTTPMWYNIGGFLLSSIALNYVAAPFRLLTLSGSFRAWGSVFFLGHIIIAVGLGALSQAKAAQKRQKKAA